MPNSCKVTRMKIIIEDWPTEAKRLSAAMQEWLFEQYPGAAIVDGDEKFEGFAYAGRIIIVETKDTRTPEDIARGAH